MLGKILGIGGIAAVYQAEHPVLRMVLTNAGIQRMTAEELKQALR